MKYLLLLFIFPGMGVTMQEKGVTVFYEQLPDKSIRIFAKNLTEVPQSVKIEGTIKGMESSESLPMVLLVAPGETKYAFSLTPEKGTSYSYNYKYTYIQGDVTAVHNDDYVYQLPFRRGESYMVGQGYNERPTHMDQYAVDFNMDEGTTICAIRDGVVMQAVDNNSKGCPKEECTQYNNFILVRHEDGSIADYSHLKKRGALVTIGQEVKAGQPIGLSGSTGWASGPHLHLEVYVMRFSGQQSVKVEYHLNKGTIGIPRSMESYTQEL